MCRSLKQSSARTVWCWWLFGSMGAIWNTPWRIIRASPWSRCTPTSPNRCCSRLIGLDANKFALISARRTLLLSTSPSLSLSSPEESFLCLQLFLQLCLADASRKVSFNFLCCWKKLNPSHGGLTCPLPVKSERRLACMRGQAFPAFLQAAAISFTSSSITALDE